MADACLWSLCLIQYICMCFSASCYSVRRNIVLYRKFLSSASRGKTIVSVYRKCDLFGESCARMPTDDQLYCNDPIRNSCIALG